MNQTNQKKTILFPKPIPSTECERTEEAAELLKKLMPEDICELTTWERETVDSIRSGMAVTRIRLKELRETIERIHPTP